MDAETDARVNKALGDEDPVSYTGMLYLCRRIAMFLRDGEQTEERQKHGMDTFELTHEDAAITLHYLIEEARELTGEKPHGLIEGPKA
jgi:hypothetical protein